MGKREDHQLRIRIPQDLKDMLEKSAKDNDRTLTAEITQRLRQSTEREGLDMTTNTSTAGTLIWDLSRFNDTQEILEGLFEFVEDLAAEERYAEKETISEAIDSLTAVYDTLTHYAGEIVRLNFQVERLKCRVGE
ncbi:Arc family DNA-binding protein [Salmonella enterica]|nr:Arc family DNA-binding protein [Salmonella enterica subsp. diarizonae]EDY0792514.1 Arc family DNA-binding protein [Salmonella enterica subsp. diarizonae]EDZ9143511.1 Arc family DNA-binding protein [Salmonella enterica]EEF5695863.1 Arc family DNA-binding protein [Salmonella enterica]